MREPSNLLSHMRESYLQSLAMGCLSPRLHYMELSGIPHAIYGVYLEYIMVSILVVKDVSTLLCIESWQCEGILFIQFGSLLSYSHALLNKFDSGSSWAIFLEIVFKVPMKMFEDAILKDLSWGMNLGEVKSTIREMKIIMHRMNS